MTHSRKLAFTKLEALGNDFVLIDGRRSPPEFDPSAIARLADRRRGIGFDQMLVLKARQHEGHVCEVAIYNADGGRAEQCGNGMRAVALWLHDRAEIRQTARIGTPGGPVDLDFANPDRITVSLGVPDFSPAPCGLPHASQFPVTLPPEAESLSAHGVSLGNPHLVIVWPDPPTEKDVLGIGPEASTWNQLENGANIGLVHRVDDHTLDLRVFERGAGPTLACGSGACAAAVVMIRLAQARSPVKVVQPGGTVVINWHSEDAPVSMTGPAREVFQGTFAWPR